MKKILSKKNLVFVGNLLFTISLIVLITIIAIALSYRRPDSVFSLIYHLMVTLILLSMVLYSFFQFATIRMRNKKYALRDFFSLAEITFLSLSCSCFVVGLSLLLLISHFRPLEAYLMSLSYLLASIHLLLIVPAMSFFKNSIHHLKNAPSEFAVPAYFFAACGMTMIMVNVFGFFKFIHYIRPIAELLIKPI